MSQREPLMVTFDPKSDALELRGRAVFKAMADHGYIELVELDERNALRLTDGILYVDCGNPGLLPMVEEMQNTRDVAVIVDVHFPLLQPNKIQALQTDTAKEGRQEHLDEEAREYWTRPENLAAARGLISNADAVTCPWTAWTRGLERYNDGIVVTPDVRDVASASLFYRRWMKALRIACETSRPGVGWLDRYTAWKMKASFQQHLKEIKE